MRICKIIVAFAISSLLTLSFFADNVYGRVWNYPDGGYANSTIHYGTPLNLIADYNSSAYEFRLGVKCIGYASATATGDMYVLAKATSTGWVTATIKWFIKGYIFSGGLAHADAYVTVKLVIFDKTANAIDTEVLLHTHGHVGPEWRLDTVNIPLYANHRYTFYFSAEAHAHGFGLGGGIADIAGFYFQDPSYRIEWGYLEVPNTVADTTGGCPILSVYDGSEFFLKVCLTYITPKAKT